MKSRKPKLPGLFLFYSFLPYKLVKILKRLILERSFCSFNSRILTNKVEFGINQTVTEGDIWKNVIRDLDI